MSRGQIALYKSWILELCMWPPYSFWTVWLNPVNLHGKERIYMWMHQGTDLFIICFCPRIGTPSNKRKKPQLKEPVFNGKSAWEQLHVARKLIPEGWYTKTSFCVDVFVYLNFPILFVENLLFFLYFSWRIPILGQEFDCFFLYLKKRQILALIFIISSFLYFLS